MRTYSKVLFLLVLFVLCPIKVLAGKYSCTNEEKVYWKNLAKNVAVSYDAVVSGSTVKFTITFSNMTKDLEIYDQDNQKIYSTNKNEYTITKTHDNKTYRFDIYSKDRMCGRVSSYTTYAAIPAYNKYQNDVLCKGIESYKLCQKWVSVEYSYDVWKQKVQSYRDSLKVEREPIGKKEHTSLLEKIVDIYSNTYYIFLPILAISCMIGIYIYNKRRELF